MEVEPDGWVEVWPQMPLRQDMFVTQIKGHSMEPAIPDSSRCVFGANIAGPLEGKQSCVQILGCCVCRKDPNPWRIPVCSIKGRMIPTQPSAGEVHPGTLWIQFEPLRPISGGLDSICLLRSAKILIVDDNPTNRSFLVTLLGYYGHSLREASDGAEALALASTEPPDLVIADMLMPTMDGYEFVRRLREIAEIASTPVIFCTAHFGERDGRDLAMQCGISQVLTKPGELEAVLRAVDDCFGQFRARNLPIGGGEFRP
jgi:CheY-like chemotaxis protein